MLTFVKRIASLKETGGRKYLPSNFNDRKVKWT